MKSKNIRLKAIEKIIKTRKKEGYYIHIVKRDNMLESNIGCFNNVDEDFIDKMIVKYNH